MDENRRVWPGDPARGEIEVVSERVVWEDKVARLYLSSVRVPDPDGGPPIERERFRLDHGADETDGVVMAPVADDGRLLLVRQFRHPVRMWLHELPRGAGNKGEAPADSARRELHEELGCETIAIHPLGRIANDSGQLSGIPYLFVAEVREGGEPEREVGETIDRVVRRTFTELKSACQRGDVIDSFTLAVLLRLEPHFDGDRFAFRPELAPGDPVR